MTKLKRWFKKKWLLWKYKHNYNTGELIPTNDRQLGLTTQLINECLWKNYVLLVPTIRMKDNVLRMMRKELYDPCMTTTIKPEEHVMSLHDIKAYKHRGRRVKFIADNSCNKFDVQIALKLGCEIVNGFVYK